MRGLSARYRFRDTDGTGLVAVEARSGAFAGASEAWFADGDLVRFGEELLVLPLDAERTVRLSGGCKGPEAEEHVGLTVRPLEGPDRIGVTARLATPSDQLDPADGGGEVRLVLPVSYDGLRRFGTDLLELVGGRAEQARLELEVLA